MAWTIDFAACHDRPDNPCGLVRHRDGGYPCGLSRQQICQPWIAFGILLCTAHKRRHADNEQLAQVFDLAKSVFQVHGIDAAGQAVVRKSLRRAQMLPFFAKLPPCLVGIEACGTSHHWARELIKLGHEVRLMPPAYVKASRAMLFEGDRPVSVKPVLSIVRD